jgi:hypothetical protein
MATILDFVAMFRLTWTLLDHIGTDMDTFGEYLAISSPAAYARSSPALQ